MTLHILEYPETIPLETLREALALLGFDMKRMKSLLLTTDHMEAEMYVESLGGQVRPATVTVRTMVSPTRRTP